MPHLEQLQPAWDEHDCGAEQTRCQTPKQPLHNELPLLEPCW